MKLKRFFLLSFALLLGAFSLASAQPSYVKWDTKVEHISGDSYRVLFLASIDSGWHMYDMKDYGGMPNNTIFTFEPGPGVTLDGGVSTLQKATVHMDPMFNKEIGYYEGNVTFVQKVKLTSERSTLKANVEWQLCDDQMCIAPTDEDFEVELVAVAKPAAAQTTQPAQTNNTTVAPAATTQTTTPVQEPVVTEAAVITEAAVDQPDVVDVTLNADSASAAAAVASEQLPSVDVVDAGTSGSGTSIWSLILEAMLWALFALLTPCVFPMIPMTVSYFMKGSENAAAGRFRAAMYGFFIVALYTLPIAALILITRFVGGESVTTNIFNWLATHWLPNIIFFLVFMIFAASFFGAFEIVLPSKVVNKADGKAGRGGLGGVFFMALTLVLVSFSCTGPIVGNVIINSVQGQYWQPIVTILAFSIVFALPFTLFAIFPSMLNKMPKSGGWLNSVKVVLGFIELALGLKFLSTADQTYGWGLLDREVYLALWIVIFSLLGIYLLGKLKFAHDSEMKHLGVGRLLLAILSFTFVVYLVPGMWGAPLKGISGYLPPMHTQDFVIGSGSGAGGSGTTANDVIMTVDGKVPTFSDMLHLPHNLQGFYVMEEAKAYAKKADKPIFIDVTGHGCVNCREMEARVWSDPRVLQILRDEFVLCALYVDDKRQLPEDQWVVSENGKTMKTLGRINADYVYRNYNVNFQPYYIILGNDQETVLETRQYDLSVDGFIQFLNDGVAAYKAGK